MPGGEGSQQQPQGKNAGAATFVDDPDVRRLFDYWRSLRRGRPMPSIRDIDPIDISWALSRLFLVDYIPEEGFVYRLAGDEIARVFERSNLKGLNLRDFVKPERLAVVERAWRRAVEQQCVISMKGMVYYGANRSAMGERLVLPLGDDTGSRVTGLLGMTVCEWQRDAKPVKMRQPDVYFLPVADIP